MSANSPSRWLFGPASDLLLGCGLGYMLVFVALVFAGEEIRTALPAGFLPFLTLLTGAPHYGATVLRVYERREDRRAYALFAVWVSLLLLILFATATRLIWVGSLLLTAYISWSPWHYSGQNYGLAMMFLRRRGVAVDGTAKRLVYASFLLSFLLTLVTLHRAHSAGGYAPAIYAEKTYRFIPLGIPAEVADSATLALLSGYLLALAGSVVLLGRRARLRDVVPSALLAVTQALWFSIPVITRHFDLLQNLDPFAREHGTYNFFWAALGHSVQYIWVTTYYAGNAPGFPGRSIYLGKALLAGAAMWTVPAFLFAPGLLGQMPFDRGLAALVASTVNLHHFILDGAIWKLRDGRVARILLRPPAPEPITPGAAERSITRGWLGAALWSVCAASFALMLFAQYESEFGLRRALEERNPSRVQAAVRRLAWMGRDSDTLHLRLAVLQENRGNIPAALYEIERSLALHPSADAWVARANLLDASGRRDEARQAYATALELDAGRADVLHRLGSLWLERGELGRALPLLERAAEREPENPVYRMTLERARRRAPVTNSTDADTPPG